MKKRSEETQTLHAGCSKAEPKFFTPPQTPFPVAWDDQNLISWRWSLPLPTNPVWRGSMHAISSYRSKRPTSAGDGTHKHTRSPTHKQTGPITIHCTAASAQCNNTLKNYTSRTWFSCFLRHPAKKWSGSILTTLEPTRGSSNNT